jgi:hypothetical protein
MTAKNRGFLYLLLFHFTTPPPLSFPYQNSFLNLVFNFYHRGEKGREEIGGVHLSSQLERTTLLCS